MTVSIDQYGYMVCSNTGHTGVCDCVRTVMMSSESSHMLQSCGLIQIPVPPICAQIHFKQSFEGKWYSGHDLPNVPVQMFLEWMPDGSSRHWDDYIGTYLPGDTMRDVYMQIKVYLFDRYAPEADYESFSSELKCPSKVHDQAAETNFRKKLPEHEKVANLLCLLTEHKCITCVMYDVGNKIDMDKYVPDINGGPQARSQNPQNPGRFRSGPARRRGDRNYSPQFSSPGDSPLSPSMSVDSSGYDPNGHSDWLRERVGDVSLPRITLADSAQLHTTEGSSSIQGTNIRFGILDEASNFQGTTESLTFSGGITFDSGSFPMRQQFVSQFSRPNFNLGRILRGVTEA